SLDAGTHASAGLRGATAGSLPGLDATIDSRTDARLAVAGHHIDGQGQARATAAVRLPAKEELPGETHDRAISAAFDTGAAGEVRVQAPDG
ncbi:hypothetical protein ABTJ37_20865, partial [Acinetobacter baumannii]